MYLKIGIIFLWLQCFNVLNFLKLRKFHFVLESKDN